MFRIETLAESAVGVVDQITEFKATVITPGGRVGNNAKRGSRSNGENWVERTKKGSLPEYIRIIRNGIMKQGKSEGRATALAVAAVKRWAKGAGNVSAKVRAAAAKAVEEWTAMKAQKTLDGVEFDWNQIEADSDELASKSDEDFEMEFKSTARETGRRKKDEDGSSGSGAGKDDFNSKHPRGKAGSSRGGKFVKKNSSDSDGGKPGDKPKGRAQKYKIKKGDTLSELAEKFNTTVSALMRANPKIKDKDLIYTGDDLRIPLQGRGKNNDTDPKKPEGDPKNGKLTNEQRQDRIDTIRDKIEKLQEEIQVLRSQGKKRGRTGKKYESAATAADTDGSTMSAGIQTKGTGMHLEYKTAALAGFEVEDEEKGIVTTYVSVTGIVDNVKDVIEAGAYEKSLNTRTPKGVWSHAWDTPVSKTLDIKELPPGDSDLPERLPNGQPWPTQAGALKVKTQFNLDTQRGREAYSDVTFFGPEQEWSIGYQVPVGGATIDRKTGQRHIHTLELYEYSPVLFGAMSAARTANVKDARFADGEHDIVGAQVAYKSMTMPEVEFKEWMGEVFGDEYDFEYKAVAPKKPRAADDEDDDTEDEDPDELFITDEDDENEDEEDADDAGKRKRGTKSAWSAYERETLVKAFHEIADAIGYKINEASFADDEEEYIEILFKEDGGQASSLSDVAGEYEDALGSEVLTHAEDFDTAVEDDDPDAAEEAGNAILDILEAIEDPDDETREAINVVARAIAELAPESAPDDEPVEDEETPVDEEDTEQKEKTGENDDIEKKVLSVSELDAFRASLLGDLPSGKMFHRS